MPPAHSEPTFERFIRDAGIVLSSIGVAITLGLQLSKFGALSEKILASERDISRLQAQGSSTLQAHLEAAKEYERALNRRIELLEANVIKLTDLNQALQKELAEIRTTLKWFEQRAKANDVPLSGGGSWK